MRDYLPFVVIGLTNGSVYSIAALGLTLTYTTSGVFNFAHGAVGMFAAYVFYTLNVELGLPVGIAAVIAVFGLGPVVGVVIDRLLLRRLHGAPAASYVVVSLGLLLALQGLVVIVYGALLRSIGAIFPRTTFQLFDVAVGFDQAMLVLMAAGLAFGLLAFFRTTRLGVQTRAVVDDPQLTEVVGINSSRVTTFSWMLGSTLAALSGVLLATLVGGLDPILLILLVIQSFGAAVVGRLVSLPAAYLGGVAIGIGGAIATKALAGHPSLQGFPISLPFLVLFAVLVFSRKGRFAEVVKISQRASARQSIGARAFPLRTLAGGLAIAVVIGAALQGGAPLLTATSTLAFVLVFSSLSLLVGLSRQVSLTHAVFLVVGATTLSRLQDAGWPFLPALLTAGLILVPVGAVVALPAVRLSGVFLALATFGFGILSQQVLYTSVLAGQKSARTISRPEIWGVSFRNDRAFYFLVLAVVLAGVTLVEVLRVTRMGRVLRGLADSPLAIQSLAINPTFARVQVFCLSAFLAGIAGGLIGTLTSSINPQTFGFLESLVWVAVLIAAGPETFLGCVVAAVALVTVPSVFTAPGVREWQPVVFGLGAILLAQAPNGLVGLLKMPRVDDWAALSRRSAWRLENGPLKERMMEAAR